MFNWQFLIQGIFPLTFDKKSISRFYFVTFLPKIHLLHSYFTKVQQATWLLKKKKKSVLLLVGGGVFHSISFICQYNNTRIYPINPFNILATLAFTFFFVYPRFENNFNLTWTTPTANCAQARMPKKSWLDSSFSKKSAIHLLVFLTTTNTLNLTHN